MSIKIPISADFNGDDIKKQIAQINSAIKQMGENVAKANGKKFEPITLKGRDDLKYFVQQSDKLLKIQGELKNRMVKSGQDGKNPVLANWNQMYLNESTRLKRQQEMLVFLGGSFEEPSQHGGGGGRFGAKPWVRQGTRIIQSGLNAAGPAGGVAANALGTGMSAGFGAGLMGLVGGMAALGVGKLVGAVTEKIDQAEQNNIVYDRLKRTLGDVNVTFSGLKSIIQESGNNLAITFDEAGKLSTQFAKLANLSDDQYKQLAPELATGVGFSRGFGLDPSQGMGMLGTMRGLRITGNDQESRRMALLIGETIGKSGAFAKAEDVMDAIAGYATQQTRNALSAANVSGYAGTFSALASSGIPGLDPAGAGGMLSRINSALMSGGAYGEASQFFSSMVANRMGLDPIQMAIMREGGAFATNDQMFGSGSAAARYGVRGPGGSSTFLQETLGTLRSKYDDQGMLAMATANHLGIGVNQAMALLSVNPNEMGTLQRGLSSAGIDMSTLNSAGIANLAKIYTGSGDDRQAIANSLYGRTGNQALTSQEADRLRTVMASGDEESQKKMLAELVATRDQERTQGSDIRDSKNLLDNIKTSMADKLIPLVTEMRHGIMAIAGVGKDGMTPQKIQEKVIRAEFEDKAEQIRQRYQSKIAEQEEIQDRERYRSVGVPINDETPDDVTFRQHDAVEQIAAATAEIRRIEAERDKELLANQSAADEQVSRAYGTNKFGKSPISHEIIAQIESGGQHYDSNGNILTSSAGAMGRMQTMPGTLRDPGFGVTPAKDFSPEEMERVGKEYIDAMYGKYGDIDKALAAYNWGPGKVDKSIAEHGDGWFSAVPKETRDYVAKYNRLSRKQSPAQLPSNDNGSAAHNSVSVSVPPIEVVHRNERGESVAPTQSIQPIVSSPWRPN